MNTSEPPALQAIAIVGRPNVGKSALFNRIVRRRLSIVHEESGVTRDRVSAGAAHEGRYFTLIDTGGVGMIDRNSTRDQIETGTRRQVDVAIEDAAVVLFVVDITAGILPLDEEVARLLHQSGRPVVLAANKADNEALEVDVDVFRRFGFPVVPVSALHGRGVPELLDDAVKHLAPTAKRAQMDPLKVAVVGRPNVGKSSFINRLLRDDRVIVSDVAGTTRDSIEIPFTRGRGAGGGDYTLIDTAGLRRMGKVHDAVERYSVNRAEKSIKRADVVVLMIDASRGPSRQDKKIASLILEAGGGCVVVVNKWDLAQEGDITQRRYTPALKEELHFLDYIPIEYVSSKTGYNIRACLEAIDLVAEQVRTQLSTGVLNQVLKDALAQAVPPSVRGKRLKIYYATQVGIRPIRLKLFVNHKSCLTQPFKAYLLRRLRERFGLEGAPIELIVTPHKRPKAD